MPMWMNLRHVQREAESVLDRTVIGQSFSS